MKILKFKNGNLNLRLEPDFDKSKYGDYTLDEILHNHDVFMNDLYFKIDAGGLLWLIDYNKSLAYEIPMLYMFNPSYWQSYNFFKSLIEGKTVKLIPYGTIKEVREYFSEDVV